MPRTDNDTNLAESLEEIRIATGWKTLTWKRLLHPVTGEHLAFKGSFVEPKSEVFILDDSQEPSLTRYPEEDDPVFDAIVLGTFTYPVAQEDLVKLIRLVRQLAT
jgi:hypothetical protein